MFNYLCGSYQNISCAWHNRLCSREENANNQRITPLPALSKLTCLCRVSRQRKVLRATGGTVAKICAYLRTVTTRHNDPRSSLKRAAICPSDNKLLLDAGCTSRRSHTVEARKECVSIGLNSPFSAVGEGFGQACGTNGTKPEHGSDAGPLFGREGRG